MHSGVFARKDQPFPYQPRSPLCFCLCPPPDPAGMGPVSETRAPVPTQLSGRLAWLWYQIVGIPEEVPLPRVSVRICDCHPASRHAPSARARHRRCAALRELRGAFPGPLRSLGPRRGDSSGWGSWFREGLDGFGCFKIDFLVPWCFWGRGV